MQTDMYSLDNNKHLIAYTSYLNNNGSCQGKADSRSSSVLRSSY
ncbi:hypothetical protein DSUL_160024 [Desulfovibrionales bacterium]